MGWFGPDKDDVWRQVSARIGGEFVAGGFCRQSKVRYQSDPWTITLDSYVVSTGHAHVEYTRMRAPFVNPDGLRFKVYRKTLLTGLGAFFGMYGIETGDPAFDEVIVLKGNDENRVRDLFASPDVRSLVLAQPRIRLQVKDSEGWFGPSFPSDADELHFQVTGIIKDVALLTALFGLFATVLQQLSRIGVIVKEDPGVFL